jgi:hypothetical protein
MLEILIYINLFMHARASPKISLKFTPLYLCILSSQGLFKYLLQLIRGLCGSQAPLLV